MSEPTYNYQQVPQEPNQNQQPYTNQNQQPYTNQIQEQPYQPQQEQYQPPQEIPCNQGEINNNINAEFLSKDDGLADDMIGRKLTSNTRMGFIKKVFGIVATMLTVTAVCVIIPMYNKPVYDYIQDYNASLWLTIVCFITLMVCMYALGCYNKIARSVPTNYILLGIFCLCESWLVCIVTTFYEPESVLISAVITAAMTIGLTLYAIFTKTDFTWCTALLFSVLAILFVSAFMSIFFYSRYLEILISACVAFIVSIYIIIDIQLITGKHSFKFSIDDYVMAAMCLYIDIIRLFMELLSIFGNQA